MKYLLILFVFINYFGKLNAQSKNDLIGLYKGNKKNIYKELEFLGNGYVKVNQLSVGEYFHENDSLFILSGNDVALFNIQENKIKGLSEWIKKEELKLNFKLATTNTSIFSNNHRAELLKRYYINNNQFHLYQKEDHITTLDLLNQINHKNFQLCEDGLDLGCIQNFSYLTVLLQNQKGEDQERTLLQMYDLANRVISLNNADGYGLLFTYYLIKDEDQLAEKYLEKGLELGSQLCMILSMEKNKE